MRAACRDIYAMLKHGDVAGKPVELFAGSNVEMIVGRDS
jgi:hypothetical protein